MAFNSTSNIQIQKIVINANLNTTRCILNIINPSIISTLNSLSLKTTIPKILTVISTTTRAPYSLNVTLPKPQLNTLINASLACRLNINLVKPVLNAFGKFPNVYSCKIITKKVQTVLSATAPVSFRLTKQLSRPVITSVAVLTFTGNRQTWVFNTITTAHSRYTNYDFNSYFKIGTKNYGTNSNGIFELIGNTDWASTGNTNITGIVQTPVSDFNEQQLKSTSEAFINCRTEGQLEVQIVADEEQKRTGFNTVADSRNGIHRRRVLLPKGLRGNSWQFFIKNIAGCTFDITSFEVNLRTLQRVKW